MWVCRWRTPPSVAAPPHVLPPGWACCKPLCGWSRSRCVPQGLCLTLPPRAQPKAQPKASAQSSAQSFSPKLRPKLSPELRPKLSPELQEGVQPGHAASSAGSVAECQGGGPTTGVVAMVSHNPTLQEVCCGGLCRHSTVCAVSRPCCEECASTFWDRPAPPVKEAFAGLRRHTVERFRQPPLLINGSSSVCPISLSHPGINPLHPSSQSVLKGLKNRFFSSEKFRIQSQSRPKRSESNRLTD